MALPRRKDDALLKSAFEEAFPDLLRFYFKDADTLFDMEKGFQFLDKEMRELFPERTNSGGTREVDMLVKTFLKDGKEEWIMLHLEIQGNDSQDFSHRMFQYFYRIYDRYRVNIAALAVFTGSKEQYRPDHFHKAFQDTEILYKYKVYHVLDHTEQQLLELDNYFALIVLAAQKALLQGKIPEQELAAERLSVARAMIESKKYTHEQISKFLYFLKNFLYISDPEINRTFDQQINKLTGKEDIMGIIETIKMITKEEGIQEGMQKGMQKGMELKSRAFVINLITQLQLSDEAAAGVAEVPLEYVQQIRKELQDQL